MEEIILEKVNKQGNCLSFIFSVTSGLEKYFSGQDFVVEYPQNIEKVPDGIAAIPFVSNVLPIIWLTDSRLRLQTLDQAFFQCLPDLKKGYETMFPESRFAGEICVGNIVECHGPATGGTAAFFSGGLDAVHTLVSHMEEKPHLISVWGSDIRYENSEGWETVHRGIAEYAQKYDLPDVVIRSSFRVFDREGVLHEDFSKQLKDGWWHGVKHGVGLLGHAAPYAWLEGLSTVYIASSNCPLDGPVRCASNPLTDNCVRFVDARVVHDGFAFSRQDKVHNVVDYVRRTGDPLTLHVCWESQTGGNCCHCEKCYRTMTALIAEGVSPDLYGFLETARTISQIRKVLILDGKLTASTARVQWTHIQSAMKKNLSVVKQTPYWSAVKWIIGADFLHIDTLKMPLSFRIRNRLSRIKLYQLAHKIKEKFHA